MDKPLIATDGSIAVGRITFGSPEYGPALFGVVALERLGEGPGHPFRGNQWADGQSGPGKSAGPKEPWQMTPDEYIKGEIAAGRRVMLYRGDKAQVNAFDVEKTDEHALFGQGIYLTNKKRIASDYETKGGGAEFRYGGKKGGPKKDAIEAYVNMQARFIDKNGKPFTDIRSMTGVELPAMVDDPIRLKRIAAAQKQWDEVDSKRLDVRALADGDIVFVPKQTKGVLTAVPIEKSILDKTINAETEVSDDVASAIGNREAYRFATTEDEQGFRPSLRDVWNQWRPSKEEQQAFRDSMTEDGYTGIRYQGGITMGGGGKHEAYSIWDGGIVNKSRGAHKAMVLDALRSGKLSKEEAARLGHFKRYPDLADKYKTETHGESAGHPFRGNQWTKGKSGHAKSGGLAPGSPERAANFKKWFGDSKVVDEDGKPLVVYHGTNSTFDSFDKSKANIESDMGAGFYFTNEPADVSANYAGRGPDITQKIQLEAERIAGEEDKDYNDPDVIARAAAKFAEHEGAGMPVYLKIENPAVLGGEHETYLDMDSGYDEESDGYDEPTGKLVDFMDAIEGEASRYDDGSIDEFRSSVFDSGYDGGMSLSELHKKWNESKGTAYFTDENGKLAQSEIFRAALERVGYDGIIDHTVNRKFGSQKRIGQPMEGMNPDTVHYIVFKSNQVKSAIGNTGEFDPYDARITHGRIATDSEGYAGAMETLGESAGHPFRGNQYTGGKGGLPPGDPQRDANFKAWFSGSKVVDENGNPAVAYHGTFGDFDAFDLSKGNQSRLDRALGPHFAMDPSVASSFVKPDIDSWTREDRTPPGGNVKPVYLAIKNPKVIDQSAPEGAGLGKDWLATDETAVAQDMINEVMPDNPEMFARWFSRSRNSTEEKGLEVFDRLSKGLPVEGHSPGYIWHKKLNPVAAFVANYDGMLYMLKDEDRAALVSKYRKRLLDQGYDGIQYTNTSPMETAGAKNRKTFIALKPTQIKSATGNLGTFDPEDPRITHGRLDAGSIEYMTALEKLGDAPGHPFHGNQYEKVASGGQARAARGGQYGPNGEWYPAGSFIATTDLPKKDRAKFDKLAGTGREVVDRVNDAPVWGEVPPGKINITQHMGTALKHDFTLNQDFVAYQMREFGSTPEGAEGISNYYNRMTEAVSKTSPGNRFVDVADFPDLASVKDLAKMIKAGMPVPKPLADRFSDDELIAKVMKHLPKPEAHGEGPGHPFRGNQYRAVVGPGSLEDRVRKAGGIQHLDIGGRAFAAMRVTIKGKPGWAIAGERSAQYFGVKGANSPQLVIFNTKHQAVNPFPGNHIEEHDGELRVVRHPGGNDPDGPPTPPLPRPKTTVPKFAPTDDLESALLDSLKHGRLEPRSTEYLAAFESLGESAGHPFRGNQYTGGHGDGGYSPDESAPVAGEWIRDQSGNAVRWNQKHSELVSKALNSWAGDPANLRIHVNDILDGEGLDSPSGSGKQMRAQAAALLWEARNSGISNAVPLYRGAGSFSHRGLTSWSENKKVAKRFAMLNGGSVETIPAGMARGIKRGGPEDEWILFGDGGETHGEGPGHPFRGNQYTGASVIFEVAPDPNDKALAGEWNKLSHSERLEVSTKIANALVPAALPGLKAKGTIRQQIGSYGDDTNPSFSLRLSDGDPVAVAKALGYGLAQDSMVAISHKPFASGSPTGATLVNVGARSVDEIHQIYQKLRTIKSEAGESLVGGQTTSGGKMLLLNFSGVPDAEFSQKVHDALGGGFEVITRKVHAAFPEKKEYNYDAKGNDGPGGGGLLRGRARGLRSKAAAALRKELEARKGKGFQEAGKEVRSPGPSPGD